MDVDFNKKRKQAIALSKDDAEFPVRLAALLVEIVDGGLHKVWGFKSFRSYCSEELKRQTRSTQYLIYTYRRIHLSPGVPHDRVLRKLNRSQLRYIAACPHVGEHNLARVCLDAIDLSVTELKQYLLDIGPDVAILRRIPGARFSVHLDEAEDKDICETLWDQAGELLGIESPQDRLVRVLQLAIAALSVSRTLSLAVGKA